MKLFAVLKQAVEAQAGEKLGIRKPLKDWTLQDIRDFQADLEAECRSSVSEKWFYTHFKNDSPRLPRIDVLNLLAGWLGQRNWDEFIHLQGKGVTASTEKTNKRAFSMGLIIIVLTSFFAWFLFLRPSGVELRFVDAYTRDVISPSELKVRVNQYVVSDRETVLVEAGDSVWVDGAYYKPRVLEHPPGTANPYTVEMFPDDYALMLNYFSRSTAEDLEKRRAQLIEAIDPAARVFQSHPEYDGIEMLNREEFIDRLLLPVNALKNLEIQHIQYRDERIFRLQFVQKSDEDETP